MTDTVFFRLLDTDDKATALADAVAALRAGIPSAGITHLADPQSFRQVPGSPFAYWVSEAVRRKFTELPAFEGNGRTVKQGLATADDFRFVRAWWEVGATRIIDGANAPRDRAVGIQTWCRQRTFGGKQWMPFAKGGAYSRYYADLHLVVNWRDSGRELAAFERAVIRNSGYYFLPGLTWPLRTQGGFSVRTVPAGAAFGHKGPMAFAATEALPGLLGLANSQPLAALVGLQMAFGSYEVGVIQRTPVPVMGESARSQLSKLALSGFSLKRALDTANETSHAFHLPALLQAPGVTLAERQGAWRTRAAEADVTLDKNQREIDDLAYALYGIADEDRRALEATGRQAKAEDDGDEDDEDSDVAGTAGADSRALTFNLLSYALGCAFGRWDIRIACDPTLAPNLAGPFDPLPVCSPGMLVGPDGLPAGRERIASEAWLRARPDAITLPPMRAVSEPAGTADAYPLPVAWDGILVDDSDHPEDIVRRVRAALVMAWGGAGGPLGPAAADALEREICAALGVKELRDCFRNPRAFFVMHLRRYSKSRRKAPIYWPLQSKGRLYTLWLYYHRLDADMLHKARMRYVEPKLALEEARLRDLEAQRVEAGIGPARRAAEHAIDRQQEFLADLRDFRDRLARAAGLGLAPDLDDGVLLNAASLHDLLPPAFKPADEAWRELLAGRYAWSSIGRQLRAKGMVKEIVKEKDHDKGSARRGA